MSKTQKGRRRLTEKVVRGAEPRAGVWRQFDDEVRGFGLAVYPSGARAFVLSYRFGGRKKLHTLGPWPEWTTVAARERARILRREIDAGRDPQEERTAVREAPTFADLVARYEREHLPRLAPRNAADQRSMMRNLVLPAWQHLKVAAIAEADVEDLLATIAKGRARPSKAEAPSRRKRPLQPARPTPIRANRVGEVLKKMFSLSIRWKMRTDNPAAGFYRRHEVARDRFLEPEEILRLAAVLAASTDARGAAIVRMLMLTGARLGEVLAARFEQFDLHFGVWAKPAATTKQKKIHRVPVSDDVVAIVRQRRAALGAESGWLFPGDVAGKDQPVQDIRKFWSRVRAEAGQPDLRLHDLRHSFAALLASGGASLSLIGALLGHTQAATTLRYSHLTERAQRAGVDSVAAALRPTPRLVE